MSQNELGFYFKTVRYYKQITKTEMVRKCGVTIQFLTKIEDNLFYQSVSDWTGKAIRNALEVKGIKNIVKEREFYSLVDKFLIAIVYYQADVIKNIKNYFERDDYGDESIDYLYFPYYLLMKYIYLILYSKNTDEAEFIGQVLKRVDEHFESKYRQLFYLYTGVFLKNQNRLTEALQFLEKAKEFGNDDMNTAMIYYHTSIVHIKQENHITAYTDLSKATELFERMNNHKRKIHCLSHMGLVCMIMHIYPAACQNCYEAIKFATMDKDEISIAVNYTNLACIHLLMKDYPTVLENIKLAFDHNATQQGLYFMGAYACMKLNDKQHFKSWIKMGYDKIADEKSINYILLKYTERLGNTGDKEKILTKIVQRLEKAKEEYDKYVLYFFYTELIECLRQNGKSDLAVFYYEKILKF